MNAENTPAVRPAQNLAANADKKSNAGLTPDPWEVCATLEYGADRTLAWSVRQQVVAAPPTEWTRYEDRLLKLLAKANTTPAGRAFVCQLLALIGSARSVPALAGLLTKAEDSEAARYALQAIPGPEASAALREALPRLNGTAKAGLIGSLAQRRDREARPALATLAQATTEPALVRTAAARALETLDAR